MFESLLTTVLAEGLAQLFAYVARMGGLAVVTILLIEYAQQAHWIPWLDADTSDKAKRAIAALAAAAGAVGLSYSYNGAAEQIVIDGVSPTKLATIVVAVASQFGLQQLLFNLVMKRFRR